MKLDVEQSLKQLIAVLLTLRAKYSLLALKPAIVPSRLANPDRGQDFHVNGFVRE
ncbi:hypothetical protein Krac_1136 [Ktedonobacter racemifer DSM 44963]|uniref:Uncharacterized protein n=1 Tax=Ktedonobacter racemifer DSM 44963 TaxID=485913 RepID=D6U6B4_KTERA|nr:hypothetical protein Krac_1136 [Ktedonobacter racemifer DSM 44963]